MAWLLLLLLSHFSHVRLCVTPETAAHQAPPSLGFSRQEHWSGLPFPSLMHESEKWKWSRSVVSNPQRPHGLQPSRLLHPWDFPGKSTGVGCHCLFQWHDYMSQISAITLLYITIFLLGMKWIPVIIKNVLIYLHNSFQFTSYSIFHETGVCLVLKCNIYHRDKWHWNM